MAHMTACLSTQAESTPKSFPAKIWFVKSLLSDKHLFVLPPQQYYIT